MIQLLPSIEDARLIRDALIAYRDNGDPWSEEQLDTFTALIENIARKIREGSRAFNRYRL